MATAVIPSDPMDPLWGSPPWPSWLTGFRPHQEAALRQVMEAYERGVDVVLLDAPTGSGKTIMAEAVRRLLKVDGLYVANTNSLVDQFMRDFKGYARMLKGRKNYPTLDNPAAFGGVGKWDDGLTAADCRKVMSELPACDTCSAVGAESDGPVLHCDHCHPIFDCPYAVAKVKAIGQKDSQGKRIKRGAPMAVTNTAYFVTEANGPGATSGQEFVVVDECDTLESILMSQIELNISASRAKSMGIEPPPKKTVEDSWLPWLKGQCIGKVKIARKKHTDKVKKLTNDHLPVPSKMMKETEYFTRLMATLNQLVKELEIGNAVYDGYADGDIQFKPIRINHLANDKLWKHGKKWLLMSATIIDPTEYVDSVGITDSGLSWELVSVPSTFPPENRPIHIKPVANMVYKEKDTAWPQMAAGIEEILARHPDDRVLIHTVSYAFSAYLQKSLRGKGRPIMSYGKASERESVLARFKDTFGAVLLASSMDRGVDLPEDDCRVVIVTKMPFLSLKDKQVSKRMYSPGGQLWYQVQTIRSLVQMTGRHVRSSTDVGHTFILDKQFLSNVWSSGRRLLPDWWIESIDWSGGERY